MVCLIVGRRFPREISGPHAAWLRCAARGKLVRPDRDDVFIRSRFEVAAIKLHDLTGESGGRIGVRIGPGSRVNAYSSSLNDLVAYAYDLKDYQISGGPSWAAADRKTSPPRPKAKGHPAGKTSKG